MTLRARGTATSPIDTPDEHGFVMSGLTTLFLSHLAMFTMPNHEYQVVLRVEIPPEAMATYVADRASHPTTPYILGNVESDLMTLPELNAGARKGFVADVFRGLPRNPNTDPPLIPNVPVRILSIPHFRHLDPADERPAHLTYLMFGTADEAHLAHYVVKRPDFEQVLDLAAVPSWLDPVQLTAGVRIAVPALAGSLCCTNPLVAPSYAVTYEGEDPLYEISVGTSYWFDTAILNPVDPCGEPATTNGEKDGSAQGTAGSLREGA